MPIEKVFVGDAAQFGSGEGRQLVRCGERNIAVIHHRGKLYAIDNACYHHGGPLLAGDIEDMGGHPCIVCPWHGYRIALDTGEGLYVGIEPGAKGGRPRECVRSKGPKQRVHEVVIEGGAVYVAVDLSGPAWESDHYATLPLANQETPTGNVVVPRSGGGGGGGSRGFSDYRSGHVFQALRAGSGSGSGSGVGVGGGRDSKARRAGNPLAPTEDGRRRTNLSPGLATAKVGSSSDVLTLACNRIEPVCTDVKQFYFSIVSGAVERHVELGEYVEFVLPIKDSRTGQPLLRKWTVADRGEEGSLFSIIVKANLSNPGGGSTWLHDHGLHAPLPVRSVGGSFTITDHTEAIRRFGGRVLWLTAGSGIVAAYAALNSTLNDSFFAQNPSEQLHVLHLHADRSADRVIMLPAFLAWAQRFPDTGAQSETKTLAWRAFLSHGEEAHRAAAAKNKTVAAALARRPCLLELGRRLTAQRVREAVEENYGNQTELLAYVCGPPGFMNDMISALLSMGVSEHNILTDDV